MNLLDLNVDCLLLIFKYCNKYDLQNLCRAHPILNQIIEDNIFYWQTRDLLMCGHRNAPHIQNRTQIPFTYVDRLIINENWLQGRFYEYRYYKKKKLFPAKLQLERDYLYVTCKNTIRKVKRSKTEPLKPLELTEIKSRDTKSDISDFIMKNDSIFAGHICGNCFIYKDNYCYEQRLHMPNEYLYCVGFAGDIYATSTDKSLKLWRLADEMGLIYLDNILDIQRSCKTMSFNQSGNKLFCGLYTDLQRCPLREYDVETGTELILNSTTISIYDMKLKDENVLFTANFDTTFRQFDRRTNRDEQVWEDPFDSSFFCLEYDGLYAVLCGTKYYGRVNLYDIRVPKKFIQLYFPYVQDRSIKSPVYDVACDSRYLFVSTSHNLSVYDFKCSWAKTRDYSKIGRNQIRINR